MPKEEKEDDEADPEPEYDGFTMEDALAEFELAQAEKAAEQHVILESIQDEAYVEANWRFIWHRRAEMNELFASGLDNGEAEPSHAAELP